MVIYKDKKTGLFNGYREGSLGEEVVNIIGEDKEHYFYSWIESKEDVIRWDGYRYKLLYSCYYCFPLAIHKSRLIKWLPTQMELF